MKRRVAWATDVHLNFAYPEELTMFVNQVHESEADLLVLGGDIADGPDTVRHLDGLSQMVSQKIAFVLGNHDFYGFGIQATKKLMTDLFSDPNGKIVYLPALEVGIPLSNGMMLVGVDGMYDAAYGVGGKEQMRLRDFEATPELREVYQPYNYGPLFKKLTELGKAEAALAKAKLEKAFEQTNSVLFVTHVPPFKEASMYRGKMSEPYVQAYFVAGYMGAMLKELMAARPDKHMLVLCGHTHHEAHVVVADNLVVLTAPAEYRNPAVASVFDVQDTPLPDSQ